MRNKTETAVVSRRFEVARAALLWLMTVTLMVGVSLTNLKAESEFLTAEDMEIIQQAKNLEDAVGTGDRDLAYREYKKLRNTISTKQRRDW